MTGEWAAKPISIYAAIPFRTYEFFKSTVLYNGDYKEAGKQQPGSAEVVQNIANDKFAIGYSGLATRRKASHGPLAAYLWRKMLRYDR